MIATVFSLYFRGSGKANVDTYRKAIRDALDAHAPGKLQHVEVCVCVCVCVLLLLLLLLLIWVLFYGRGGKGCHSGCSHVWFRDCHQSD